MPVTSKALARTAASTTTTTTLYTVPASTTAIITNIAVCNTSASAQTFTMACGTSGSTVALFTTTAIAANTTVVIDMKQTLTAAQIITGGASATSVTFHISGVEIA